MGTLGLYPIPQYCKKKWQIVSKVNEILRDPFIISQAYFKLLKLHPSSVFIYLDLYNLAVEPYSLLCFVLHSLLTCTRQEAQMSGTTIP